MSPNSIKDDSRQYQNVPIISGVVKDKLFSPEDDEENVESRLAEDESKAKLDWLHRNQKPGVNAAEFYNPVADGNQRNHQTQKFPQQTTLSGTVAKGSSLHASEDEKVQGRIENLHIAKTK